MTLELSPREAAFVARRDRLTRWWRWIGTALLVVLAALALGLWVSQPYLVDPWQLMAAIEADRIPLSTLHLLAMLLPVAMLSLLLLVAVTLLLASAGFANERRLLAIIRRLRD